MFNNILEISKRASKGGRVPIKIALLKIHEDLEETNKNGLHWKEEYIANAIESVNMMPICASFVDEEKSIPLDHGYTGQIVNDDGIKEPVFENSETVGCFENASIEEITVNENSIKALVANGFLYSQRYPNFVKWLRTNRALGNIDTSIEIMGTPENNNSIIYEEENPTTEYRTPKEFLFSGCAILSVSPADDDAIVLEVAQKNELNKEDKTLDEKELKEIITATIMESNSKNDELSEKITELNNVIAEKDSVIAERDQTIVELNATVEQVQKALDDLKKEHETFWEEREVLEKELATLKAQARIAALEEATSSFTDEEKKYAEVEINSFNESPLDGDIDAIVSKIYAGIGEASKKAAEEAKITEQNAKKDEKDEVIDIFSEVCSEDAELVEDVNIF